MGKTVEMIEESSKWDMRARGEGDFNGLLWGNWKSLLALTPKAYMPISSHSEARRSLEAHKARQSNMVTAQALRSAASLATPAIARLLLDHAVAFESVGSCE